jgi:hypothetical protein
MTHPLWTLYSRRFGLRLGYWLSVLGFNWRDQSTSNRVYLAYFGIFWAIWAVAVFSLLGTWIAQALKLFPRAVPPELALNLAEISLVGWALYSLWRTTRRSPFVFSEEDAYLVCQTPLSRPGVALALFLLNWFEAAFPFAFGTVGICFGVVEARLAGGQLSPDKVAGYLTYSLTGLGLVLPLHLALQAAAWAVGALRLRGRRDYPILRWTAPVLLGLLIITPVVLAGGAVTAGSALQQPWLWPLYAALRAAFVPGGAWPVALLVALAIVAASLAFLLLAARRLSFSRAAQETTLQATLQTARRFGRGDLAQSLALRHRLGAGRRPSPLLSRPGSWVMVSKAVIQAVRAFTLGRTFTWFYVVLLSGAALSAPNLTVKALLGALWVLAVGNATTTRLRSDLANWGILRLLPLPTGQMFLAEFSLAWATTALLGEAALSVLPLPSLGYRLVLGAVLPFLVACVTLAAGSDVLRQARVRTLMVPALTTENVPQPGLAGLLQGLASVAVPIGLLEWSTRQPEGLFWAPLVVGAALVITVLNLEAMLIAYRWMR